MTSPSVLQPPSRVVWRDLPRLVADLDFIPWGPFYENVEIHRLYGDGTSGPCAALLRFAPGGRIPRREHIGCEHLLLLSGPQRDGQGELAEGSPAIYERPVHAGGG